ncbi:four helix bundle protein [Allocoleopsis sp.]|uniref:four helix bundle protein n=1 Tax=Allocoleopsis sp. TaxID=3088169 RepID=UPI002FD32519
MATIKRFEEIEAWQTARELTRLVYALSNEGAFARDFGLRDQMRRAAVSILSNIADSEALASLRASGFESRTQALFIEFLGRAKGSAGELRSQAYVALDAGYFNQPQFTQVFNLSEKCSRQITGFITYLKAYPTNNRLRESKGEYYIDTVES